MYLLLVAQRASVRRDFSHFGEVRRGCKISAGRKCKNNEVIAVAELAKAEKFITS